MDRFYAWCGFGMARAKPPPILGDCGYAGSNTIWEMGWRNRLRALVSGRIMVDMAHMLDKPPKVWVTNAQFSVLPPNYTESKKGK